MKKQNIFRKLFFWCLLFISFSATADIADARNLKRIGVQLYTVRNEMEKDFEGTLKRIAELGYNELEFAGLYNRDPKEVRTLVEKLGMKVVGSHINSEKLKTNPEDAIAETKSLGAKYMILAWFPPEQRKTLDDWKNWVVLINKVAKMSHEKGIQFLYHNHNFEFEPVEGIVPFDLMLETVDRRYVKFEIDLYWLKLAGRDPEKLFAKYPKGFPLVHIKDMSKTENAMVDVGDGRINFAEIFKQSETSGLTHYFVEHDDTKAPFETLKRSIKYLRSLKF
jgi:sugar phosphate isomerase/epimerase